MNDQQRSQWILDRLRRDRDGWRAIGFIEGLDAALDAVREARGLSAAEAAILGRKAARLDRLREARETGHD